MSNDQQNQILSKQKGSTHSNKDGLVLMVVAGYLWMSIPQRFILSHPEHPEYPIKISKEPTSEGLLDVLHPLNPKNLCNMQSVPRASKLVMENVIPPKLHRNHQRWNHYQQKASSSKVFGCLSITELRSKIRDHPSVDAEIRKFSTCKDCLPPMPELPRVQTTTCEGPRENDSVIFNQKVFDCITLTTCITPQRMMCDPSRIGLVYCRVFVRLRKAPGVLTGKDVCG